MKYSKYAMLLIADSLTNVPSAKGLVARDLLFLEKSGKLPTELNLKKNAPVMITETLRKQYTRRMELSMVPEDGFNPFKYQKMTQTKLMLYELYLPTLKLIKSTDLNTKT